MPQFLDREYFGYNVSLRPSDPFRNIIRVKIPRLMDLFLLPYLWGTDISFNLTIKTTKAAIPAVLEYEWQLYVEEDKKPSKAGNGIADMTTRENYKAILDLEHFSNAHKYRLDITIKTVSGERCQTVADFETSSRTAFQMFILATLFAIIGGVIGGLIVHFLGG